MLSGANARGGTVQDNFVYVAMNTHWDGHWFGLPELPDGMRWHVFANTSAANGKTSGNRARNRCWRTRAVCWWAIGRWSISVGR